MCQWRSPATGRPGFEPPTVMKAMSRLWTAIGGIATVSVSQYYVPVVKQCNEFIGQMQPNKNSYEGSGHVCATTEVGRVKWTAGRITFLPTP
jgi:hypothetical protein